MTTIRHVKSRAAEDPKPPKGGRSEAVRSSLAAEPWQNVGQYVTSARHGLTSVDTAINQNLLIRLSVLGTLRRIGFSTVSGRVVAVARDGVSSAERQAWVAPGRAPEILARVAATLGRLHDASNFPLPSKRA